MMMVDDYYYYDYDYDDDDHGFRISKFYYLAGPTRRE